MKNVLLLGDSIRLGYGDKVRELLGDKVQIFAPADNCAYTKRTLWMLWEWMDGFGYPKLDAAHWNNGIWDLHYASPDGTIFTPIDEYVRDQLRLADSLRTYTPNLCFATTIPRGPAHDDRYREYLKQKAAGSKDRHLGGGFRDEINANVRAYNAALTPKLIERGVRIDDLYTLIDSDPEKYVGPDGCHLTEEGYSAAARQVADHILAML